jgi:hypothetical protein
MNTDVFNVLVAIAIIVAAISTFGLLRVARWILWCVVRGYVRRDGVHPCRPSRCRRRSRRSRLPGAPQRGQETSFNDRPPRGGHRIRASAERVRPSDRRRAGQGGPSGHPPADRRRRRAKAPATARAITGMLKRIPRHAAGQARSRAPAHRIRRRSPPLRTHRLMPGPGAHERRRLNSHPRSKTDQEGAGHVVAVPRGSKLRPVEALDDWLEAAGIADGPVFRPVAKGGRVSPSR